jgi:hypothetical protein
VESDLSVFHRIDDLASLHPQRLIDLVVRLAYYSGVVQARIRAEAAEQEPAPTMSIDQDRTVPSEAATLATDPVLSELIDLA